MPATYISPGRGGAWSTRAWFCRVLQMTEKRWSTPMEIDRTPGLPRDDNGALEGFDGAVGADSTLYAVWAAGNHLQFTTSRDGGKTFAKVKDVIQSGPTMFAVQDFDRANGFPQIAVDARSGDHNHAHLYVTWSDTRNGDIDVFCARSVDGGKKWSAPVRVNSDTMHDGADQFFQWLTVDPVTGAVSILFYDRRLTRKTKRRWSRWRGRRTAAKHSRTMHGAISHLSLLSRTSWEITAGLHLSTTEFTAHGQRIRCPRRRRPMRKNRHRQRARIIPQITPLFASELQIFLPPPRRNNKSTNLWQRRQRSASSID